MLQRHSAVKRALSLVLCLAIILTTCVSLVGVSGKAEAAASLPYIEELKTSQQGGAFKILEIAPSAQEGSIGYYISGAEPCQYFPAQAAADKTCYETDDTTGAVTPANNREKRIELVKNKFAWLEGAGIMSDKESTPLTKLNTYDEAYPWEITKGEKAGAAYINTLTLSKGSAASDVYYEKVGADAGGGVSGLTFTAKPDSLSDGSDITAYAYNLATRYTLDTTGAYVQDVAYYTADASQIAQLTNAGDQIFYYAPSFQNITVTVTPDVDGSGNETGTQTVKATYPKGSDTLDLPDGTAIYANEADYGSKTPSTNVSAHNFYYLGNYYSAAYTGAKTNETLLDDAHTYYFVTASGTPSATNQTNKYAAVGKGFHTPAVTGETPSFAPEGGKEAYKYVGAGNGTYKCEKSSNPTKYILYTNTVFYTNCYKNNEWFKKYVFNYDDNELSSTKVNFVVETLAPNDSKLTADELDSSSLIFVSNGLSLNNTGSNTATYSSDISQTVLEEAKKLATRGTDTAKLVTPLIVDSRIAASSKTNLVALAAYATSNLGVSGSKRVHENTYLFTPESSRGEFANGAFNTALENLFNYTEVSDAIRRTNTQRQAQNPSAALVDTTISMAACVRHIINAAQPTTNKKSIRVLDIEPGNPYGGVSGSTSVLTTDTVLKIWLPDQGFNSATITTWSTSEFIARFNQTTKTADGKCETTDLANSFDIVYIGTNIDRFGMHNYKDSNLHQSVVNYKDESMLGLVYTNIGDKIKTGGNVFSGTGYKLSGSLDRDYLNNNPNTNIINTTSADQFRFSGNDLTANAKDFLETFADAGHPVVTANDIYSKVIQSQGETAGKVNITGKYSLLGLSWQNFGPIPLFDTKYSIKATRDTLVTSRKSDSTQDTTSDSNLIVKLIDAFNTSIADIKEKIEDPSFSWESSSDGSSFSVLNMTSDTLDVSSYPNGVSYFRCKATPATKTIFENAFGNLVISADHSAYTQVAKLIKGPVNDDRIDSSSYMYEFLNYIKGRTNVFSEGDFTTSYKPDTSAVAGKRIQLSDLVNISAPSIVFTTDADSKPVDYTYEVDGSGNITSMSSITPDANGKCSLTYKFTLTNPTDQAIGATRYGFNLYVDENGDGHYAASEKLSNVDVYCDDRRVTELQASTAPKTYTYSITRSMPDNFCGVIPWKLEVYKLGNEALTASQTGFSHISSNTTRPKKALKILQLTPNDYTYNSWIDADFKKITQLTNEYNTIHFGDNNTPQDDCNKLLKSNPDYDITVNEFALNSASVDTFDELNQYDMLILGFGNSYGEMTQATANAIKQFIGTGKAVLFSDDCASTYFSSSNNSRLNASGGSYQYGNILKNFDFFNLFAVAYHGYYFNTTLRDAVGLDRYGVSSQSTVKASGNKASEYYGDRDRLTAAGYSMAYTPKSNRGSTVAETQGLTNNILMAYYKDSATAYPYGYYPIGSDTIFEALAEKFKTWSETTFQEISTTNTVTQVNKGQITSYPYNVNTVSNGGTAGGGINADNINVSTTHMQPMQLNMNRSDVYVWYCLAGNSTVSSTLGSTYNYNTNDATNQYYIYSRGNVTYTGAGHYQPSTLAEKQLIVNTIIAAARQGQTAPTATFTDPNGGKANISNILVPADNDTVVPTTAFSDISRRIYFKVQDTSLVPSTGDKTFSASFSYKIGNSAAVPIVSLPVYTSDTPASAGKLDVSKVYYVKLDDLLKNPDIQGNLGNVQFQITPDVSISSTKLTGSPVSVTLNKMNLFNLG